MSATVTTTAAGRVAALARAELILFGRSKAVLLTALLVPLVLPLSTRSAIEGTDLGQYGLSVGLVLLTGAIGFSLLFAVYSALVSVFVTRREEHRPQAAAHRRAAGSGDPGRGRAARRHHGAGAVPAGDGGMFVLLDVPAPEGAPARGARARPWAC